MTMGGISSSLAPEAVMAIVCAEVDLAKYVFAVHGVDDVGKAVWGKFGCRSGLPMPQPGPAQTVTG